jgi:hypothetical protein
MRIGGGKKHGWYYLGNGFIDVTSTSHTPTAGHFTAADSVTPGDSCFIHRTLIFTYLIFALFKYYGKMLQVQVKQLEALWEADRQRMEALEAQRMAWSRGSSSRWRRFSSTCKLLGKRWV